MSEFIKWLFEQGTLGAGVASSAIFTFFLTQAYNKIKKNTQDIAALEGIMSRQGPEALVTNRDLHAAFNEFKIELAKTLSDSYVPRKEYDMSRDDMNKRMNSMDGRQERHETWHSEHNNK